jgi:hypothetical protein
MEKNKMQSDYELLYGEKEKRGLGCMAAGLIAIAKFLLFPARLTIENLRTLKQINEKTGIDFPLPGERTKKH